MNNTNKLLLAIESINNRLVSEERIQELLDNAIKEDKK